jgi:hypothetical protein
VYGDGDVALGMDHLNWKPYDHVFCALMPRLRHRAGSQTVGEAELFDLTENDGDCYKIRTTHTLTDLADKPPSTYIHCQNLDVWIQKKKNEFSLLGKTISGTNRIYHSGGSQKYMAFDHVLARG